MTSREIRTYRSHTLSHSHTHTLLHSHSHTLSHPLTALYPPKHKTSLKRTTQRTEISENIHRGGGSRADGKSSLEFAKLGGIIKGYLWAMRLQRQEFFPRRNGLMEL